MIQALSPRGTIFQGGMQLLVRLACILTILVGMSAGSFAVAQDPPGEAQLQDESVEAAAREIVDVIRDAVDDAGGNLEAQRVHLVLGFSTGHFAIDPLRAQAARHIAARLVEDFLVSGDLVSTFAFESDLWPHPGSERNPITVSSDQAAGKEEIRAAFPNAPMASTKGGHDTELAIAKITDQLDTASGPVVVLLMNRAASVTTDVTVPVIGEDDPRYSSVLETWQRVDAVNQSGASYEATFDIRQQDGTLVTRTLDVVILVPRSFSAPPLSEGTRASRLEAALATPEPAVTSRSATGFLPVLLVLLAAGLGVFALLRLRRSGSGSSTILTINSNRYLLGDARVDEDICRLVGPGYQQVHGHDERALEVPDASLPAALLARFVRTRSGVVVRDEHLSLQTVDGDVVSAPYVLRPDGDQTLVFEGQGKPIPGQPARSARMKLNVSIGGE